MGADSRVLVSGIVQARVTRGQMERVLGGRVLAATLRGTGLGASSSSCSYAAIAIAKSAFQKGAGLPAALAFMFASTNLVFELGIVLWIFLGPEFTAAEVRRRLPADPAAVGSRARARPDARRGGRAAARTGGRTRHVHTIASRASSWRERLGSVQAWSDVAHNFLGDWQMLWKEMTAGFVIAGFVAVLPGSIFEAAFLTDAPAAVQTVENVTIGPLIAVLSFVCSVGNIPLAASFGRAGSRSRA